MMWPDEPALVCGDEALTFAELAARVDRAAGELKALGVGDGVAVASLCTNSLELMVLYFALARLGAVSVPLNTMLGPAEVVDTIRRVGARYIFSDPELQDRAGEALPGQVDVARMNIRDESDVWSAGRESTHTPVSSVDSVDPESPAVVIFTSGSSSRPKGVIKTHGQLVWAAINSQLAWPRTGEDRELYVIPLAGIGFANFVLGAMLGGACVVLQRFEPASALDAMVRHRATSSFLPSTMLDSLLDEETRTGRRDLSSMRLVQTSYAMTDALRRRIAERFPGRVQFCYGLTEGSMSSAPASMFLSSPSCVGRPNGLDRFAILNPDGGRLPPGSEGEIGVSGPDVMTGYLGESEASAEVFRDGWFRTGDLGFIDEEGFLHFTGRLKDVIKTGGVNVAAAEVERVVSQHPEVVEAAVIGVPDGHWGERVHLVASTRPGSSLTADELIAFCRARLASFKAPKSCQIVEELPHNPSGKIAKGEIADRYAWADTTSEPHQP
jgi:acyl-CoA synthetase (AMP-forming)/AMP-acid ligase II